MDFYAAMKKTKAPVFELVRSRAQYVFKINTDTHDVKHDLRSEELSYAYKCRNTGNMQKRLQQPGWLESPADEVRVPSPEAGPASPQGQGVGSPSRRLQALLPGLSPLSSLPDSRPQG